jgi:hypothetical protein
MITERPIVRRFAASSLEYDCVAPARSDDQHARALVGCGRTSFGQGILIVNPDSLNGRAISCLADSNNIEPKLYQYVHSITGDVDILFLGMECDGAPLSWPYGPLLTKPLARKMDQSRRFDGSDCRKAVEIV